MQTVARGEFQHVDFAALKSGKNPGQLALGRLARDSLGLHAGGLERRRHVRSVLHAGAVDDARQMLEAHAVEVGDGRVERSLVEQRCELFQVEVLVHLALSQRHVRERPDVRSGRDPDVAQRRDHAPAGGLREVEAACLGGEEVGDVARDQRTGRGHADEDRALPAPDRGARLLAECGVCLVADHDRVGVRDVARVPDEPLIRLDRHGPVGAVLLLQQRRRDAVRVAAVLQLAEELVDEVAAVGQDQDAAGPRCLHEAERGNGLTGPGRVLEPESTGRAGILRLLGELLVLGDLVEVATAVGARISGPVVVVFQLVVGLLVLVELLLDGDGGAVPVLSLGLRDQGGERPGQRVDLVRGQHGAVRELRLVVQEQPLEAQHQ
jgi:hypothetical protein